MKQLYKSYFQKSKVFLYPLLGIRKGVRFVPIETYVTWKNYKSENSLICVYHIDKKNKQTFDKFIKDELETNEFFEFKAHTNHLDIIAFNLNYFKHDIKMFKEGKYSKFSALTKKIIKEFFGEIGTLSEYIESYLYPKRYHEIYSELLNIPISDLEYVEELCDKPDLKKENFETELVELALFK